MFGKKPKQQRERTGKSDRKGKVYSFWLIAVLLIVLSLLIIDILPSITNTYKQTNNTNANKETTSFIDKLREDSETHQEIDVISADYIGNKNTKKFHYSWCYAIELMNESNKYYYNGTREEMIDKGYKPCQKCFP